MTSRTAALAFALLICSGLASTASADTGGDVPSRAPAIAVGQSVTSTLSDDTPDEFFALPPLVVGDSLVVDFDEVEGGFDPPCLLPPGADDFNWASLACGLPVRTQAGSGNKSRYTYRVGARVGQYLLHVSKCCGYRSSYVYSLTLAGLRHATRTAVTVAPRIGTRKTPFRFEAAITSVAGIPTGFCTFERKRSGRWIAARAVQTTNGRCRTKLKASVKGKFQVRVRYSPSDGSYAASVGVSTAVFVN